jgi:hypothetical protein
VAEIPRSAVVATHNRREELYRCVRALSTQCDHIVVIDNATDPPLGHDEADALAIMRAVVDPHACVLDTVRDDEQPPNLSRLWNLGLDRAAEQWCSYHRVVGTEPRWDVAVVNDDATVPPGWFDALATPMRTLGAAAASHGEFLGPEWGEVVLGPSAPLSVTTRLAGWAFILRGEWVGARLDERFRWWCGDDDISHRARIAGGLLHIGGLRVPNEHADQSTTGVLAEQTGLDMQAFIDKWGFRPW